MPASEDTQFWDKPLAEVLGGLGTTPSAYLGLVQLVKTWFYRRHELI